VPLGSTIDRLTRRGFQWLLSSAILLPIAMATAFATPDDPQTSDSVGTIDGAAIAVSGPLRIEAAGGFTKTVLRSGSDVLVRSGVARLELIEGGSISICGPAHFSVLKSAGSLTIALENGAIHAQIGREPAVIIYTAQIQARPMAIGDGPQDVEVGLRPPGELCIRANSGAVRVEQQFTGQSMIVPQAGDIVLADGQFGNPRTGAGHCACEPEIAKISPAPQPEMSQSASREEPRRNAPDASVDPPAFPVEKPVDQEGPIYQVFMPPLVYNAKAPVQPEVDPSMIVLVRRVRVRPALIFQGRVKGETAEAKPATAPPAAAAPTNPAGDPTKKPVVPPNNSFANRVRNFVRQLWSRGP
jgi:hypothetical protein